MTVQELIDELNKIENKSKEVLDYYYVDITKIEEDNDAVMLY